MLYANKKSRNKKTRKKPLKSGEFQAAIVDNSPSLMLFLRRPKEKINGLFITVMDRSH
jgi:hypothetical protein